jgi:hypothetical protein
METIIQAGFDDVAAGTGGPFNPRIPSDMIPEIEKIVQAIRNYH